MKKKGQIAAFIIIGILIVIAVGAIFIFYPKIEILNTEQISPNLYLQRCLEPVLEDNKKKLAEQGGYANPEGYILYEGKKIKYLCYTSLYYQTCVVQEPLIKRQFEQELNKILKNKAEECVNQMKVEYERKGYSIAISKRPEIKTEIIPKKLRVEIETSIEAKRGDNVESFRNFKIEKNSEMYNLLMIATSIIDYERAYGDSESTLYLLYYPQIIVHKTELIDGSKIYKVSDVRTREKFVFASRSLPWPPGYGFVR